MSGVAGTNIDFLFPWDPSQADVQNYIKSAGFRGADKAGALWGGFRTVKIPTASVLTLNSVPIQIVPAAGAGTLIVPFLVVGTLVYNSTTYACNASGASLIYGTAGAGTNSGWTFSQAFLQAASGTNTQIVIQDSSSTYLPATTDYNAPLTLIAASADPTTGNSDLYVRVYFRIISGLPFSSPAIP